MTLKIQDAGTLRTISRLTIKQAGVNRTIRTLKVMDGGSLRTVAIFADPLTVSVSRPEVSGTQSSPDEILVNTNQTTASPSGGIAPYTYAWTNVSGAGDANSPTSATTSFFAVIPPGTSTGTLRVTVTDSGGQTATADVSATFTNLGV